MHKRHFLLYDGWLVRARNRINPGKGQVVLAPNNQRMSWPLMARDITSRWISDVPSKIV
jgi:hypothetical protein